MNIVYIVGGVIALVFVILMFKWYRIVPPSEAHLVTRPNKRMVRSADPSISKNGKASYFKFPEFLPKLATKVRELDLTIKELVVPQETYEKHQARYNVKSSIKYRISDVETAAERFINDDELQEQLKEVVRAGVRAVTVKFDVIDARAKKQEMEAEVRKEIEDDLKFWGLDLVNFQLIDFQDTEDSKIISDISRRREVEIETTTREVNAEKYKQARLKEAEAEEKAREREIEKDKTIGEKEQNKAQAISEQEKIAKEKEYAVIRVETVKQAEINKEKAIVEANQAKETEAIIREQKRLVGEGDRMRDEQIAKGLAAPIREKGFAEAEAKEKLQAALNKFGDKAITALVAEKLVEMQKVVGVATAEALKEADMKVFAGGGKDSETGFELGKMITSLSVANDDTAKSILNRLRRPNDLGLESLQGLLGKQDKEEVKTETP